MNKRIVKFFTFYFLSFLIALIIYSLTFQGGILDADYVYCTIVKDLEVNIGNFSTNIPYTFSCDEGDYFLIFESLNNIYFEKDFKYQNRPVYLLFTYLIYIPLSLLNIETLILYKFVHLNAQIFTVMLLTLLFNKIFELENNIKNYISTYFLFSLSPLIKWSMFDVGHHITTVFILLLGVLVYKNKYLVKSNLFQISLGLFFLTHRSSITLILFCLIISIVYRKEIDIKPFNYISLLINPLMPILFHELLKQLNNSGGDQNVDLYNQFFWIFDYFNNLPLKTTGWYCQSIPENFVCYISDSYSTLIYLAPLTLFVIICTIYIYFTNQNFSEVKGLFYISTIQFFFWSFIGWYPPVRFSYYAIGNLIIILSVLFFHKFLNERVKLAYLFAYSYLLIQIEHWNVENFNLLEIENTILLIIFIFSLMYKNNYKE